MKKKILIIFFLCNITLTFDLCAAGIASRQQAVAQQRQEMIQRQAMEQQKMQQKAAVEAVKGRSIPGAASVHPAGRASSGRDVYAEEEVIEIEDLWNELETSSEIWARIIDPQPKEATIAMYIEWYKQNGMVINKTPSDYVGIIDSMMQNNPEMLKNPFKDILKIVAIIEYDFDNGMNKDMMVQKVLGEQGYQENKQRLGR
jgi:hypothetical protein